MTAERTYPTTGHETDGSTTNRRTATDSRARDGPHDTPDPLPAAGEHERTLFQTSVSDGAVVVDVPVGHCGLGECASEGAVRVWLGDTDDGDDPCGGLTVAWGTADAAGVAHVYLDESTAREAASLVRERGVAPGDEWESDRDRRAEISVDGDGGRLRDRSNEGAVRLTRRFDHDGMGIGLGLPTDARPESFAHATVDGDGTDDLAVALDAVAAELAN